MRRPILVCASLLTLTGTARAQVTSLLTLTNLQQSVDLMYRVDANQGTVGSSVDNALQEDYRVSFEYAVYKARLLHGQITLDLQGNQKLFSGQGSSQGLSNGIGFLYDINGVFLDRFATPVNFFLNSTINEIPRDFASSYQQKTDNYGVAVTINNDYLPVSASFTRTTTETSGLGTDRSQVSDTLALGAAHSYRQLSQTTFSVMNTSQHLDAVEGGRGEDTDNLELTLNNTLNFGSKELNRALYSRLRVTDQTGVNQARTAELGESLNWDLGKALTSGVDYTLSDRQVVGQGQQLHRGRLWLQHRLFRSLTSRVSVDATENLLPSGKEQSVAGALSLAYFKTLPNESTFSIAGHKGYGVTSSHLENDTIIVPKESLPVSTTQQMFLKNLNVVPSSIIAENADPLQHGGLPYVLNQDYEVRQFGTQTEIFVLVPGSQIKATDTLLVTYSFLTNTDVSYSTSSQGINSDLSLFDNRYRIFASWDTSDQDLLSGKADKVNLTSQEAYRVGVQRKLDSGSVTAEYSRSKSDVDTNQTFSGAYQYTGIYGLGSLSFNLNDRYIMSDSNSVSNAQSRSENVLTAGGTYTRTLDNGAVLTASANYLNNKGFINSDNVSLGLGIRWSLRKLTVSLLSQANFRLTQGSLSTDEHLQLRLSRYF